MPLTRLPARHSLLCEYTAPRTRQAVRVLTEAENRVDVHVLSSRGLKEFKTGSTDIEVYATNKAQKYCTIEFFPDPRQRFAILLVNRTKQETVCFHSVK